jgi:hypothetical protein
MGSRRRISRDAFRNVWFDFKVVGPRNESDLIIRRLIVITPATNAAPADRRWFAPTH